MINQKCQLKNGRELKPNKRLGQNFLVNKGIIEKMISAAELIPDDTVIEIGPGLGALTLALAKKVKKVIAVEKDRGLIKHLQVKLVNEKINNVQLMGSDILDFQPSNCPQQYKIVANLPYYITKPVIMMFLAAQQPPESMILMIQKEVAQRICATPPQSNKLAIFTQFFCQPKIISYVSKNSFWPAPKVDSAIIKIVPSDKYKKQVDQDIFSKIVTAGFSQPRKQVLNNFSRALKFTKEQTQKWLMANHISPTQRAENLSLNDWIRLSNSFGN
ncbi:MAG: 16S rRNA (adenine(1518)-N(6)/adenine(1519)-N(6))-dimethyltransferase RsmA [Candidatus Pacebacteria bacterium]|nr:16S rRNA (adenine(1518)-N(6)/adenine(1519)-N(6))-dimethyltransferase RsmA [Candidatus Paceibacterota bacterium]